MSIDTVDEGADRCLRPRRLSIGDPLVPVRTAHVPPQVLLEVVALRNGLSKAHCVLLLTEPVLLSGCVHSVSCSHLVQNFEIFVVAIDSWPHLERLPVRSQAFDTNGIALDGMSEHMLSRWQRVRRRLSTSNFVTLQ